MEFKELFNEQGKSKVMQNCVALMIVFTQQNCHGFNSSVPT